MPLINYKCKEGHRSESLYLGSEKVLETIDCPEPNCKCKANKVISLVAKTQGLWGDSKGYYDIGLGAYVQNSQHRDKLMKQKGLVAESDLASGAVDSSIHTQIMNAEKQRKEDAKFDEARRKHNGDIGMAVMEATENEAAKIIAEENKKI